MKVHDVVEPTDVAEPIDMERVPARGRAVLEDLIRVVRPIPHPVGGAMQSAIRVALRRAVQGERVGVLDVFAQLAVGHDFRPLRPYYRRKRIPQLPRCRDVPVEPGKRGDEQMAVRHADPSGGDIT